jgi:hypothetical protein
MKNILEKQLTKLCDSSLDNLELLHFNYIRLYFKLSSEELEPSRICVYHRKWEIILNGKIIIKGRHGTLSIEKRIELLNKNTDFKVKKIKQNLDESIEFIFNNDLIFKVHKDLNEQEILTIFSDPNLCCKYNNLQGWQIRPSNIPCNEERNNTFYRPFSEKTQNQPNHIFSIGDDEL